MSETFFEGGVGSGKGGESALRERNDASNFKFCSLLTILVRTIKILCGLLETDYLI
jgi:hypothetical protein